MSIQRYRIEPHDYAFPHDNGEWVRFTDHEAALAEQRSKIVAWLRAKAKALLTIHFSEFPQIPDYDCRQRNGDMAEAFDDAADSINRGEFEDSPAKEKA